MQASPPPAEPAQSTAPIEAAPLLTGPTEFLSIFVIAVFAIFSIVIWQLMRWRSGRRARDAAAGAGFFQPAGEGAEITFDESDRSPAPEAAAPDAEPAPTLDQIIAEAERPKPKKKGIFGGLFARTARLDEAGPAEADAPAPEVIDLGADRDDLASVRIERPRRSVFSPGRHDEDEKEGVADWASIERAESRRHEEEVARAANEARQQAEHEDERLRAEEARRRRAESEAAGRIAGFDRATATVQPARLVESAARAHHDDLARTLSEVEEALHAQREAIQAETRNLLDTFARRFSDRLDALATSVERRASARSADAPAGDERSFDLSSLSDLLTTKLAEHQQAISQSLLSLSRRIDGLGFSASHPTNVAARAENLSAPAVQLAEIIRNALAPNGYEFNAVLLNNRRADCLIRLGRPPGPIAIDARFPVEAFAGLRSGRADAENEFRRTALRHIVDVAERLIAPGLTADSALMFIPSESAIAELHARFPDVVQDSYRARVWIVSPTTLMATLHTIAGVMRDAPPPAGAPNDAKRALAEIERLSERVAALESKMSRARPAIADILSSGEAHEARRSDAIGEDGDKGNKRLFQPASEREPVHPEGDLYADDEAGGLQKSQTRPPFPLR
jgi:DNA recombination protein RmuC